DGKPVRGVAAGEFAIPADAAGGEYALQVSDEANRFPAAKRKFLVNVYQVPTLNTELVFTRKSYGPGEEVLAQCQVARVEGGTAVARQPVNATLNVDGNRSEHKFETDGNGKVPVKVKLTDRIETGDGSRYVR